MNNKITDNEIIALYRKCDIDTNSQVVPRTTINTGTINYSSLHFMPKTSASADRLRWE